ncbi:MAG TPA: transglutaminase family protein, partial [Thermoanaerobaculia bacterium]
MTDRSLAIDRFRRLVQADPLDIFEGALAIAALIDPSADLPLARSRIAEIGSRVRARIRAGDAPAESLQRVLFAEEGFSGDTSSYDDPANSSVAHVLQTRRGMPITLSVVT